MMAVFLMKIKLIRFCIEDKTIRVGVRVRGLSKLIAVRYVTPPTPKHTHTHRDGHTHIPTLTHIRALETMGDPHCPWGPWGPGGPAESETPWGPGYLGVPETPTAPGPLEAWWPC